MFHFFPFSFRFFLVLAFFHLSCLLLIGVSLWKSTLGTEVRDILEFPLHLSHVLRPALLLLDILDGCHVCAETLVRCDLLVSDPSHWGDTGLLSTELGCNTPHGC